MGKNYLRTLAIRVPVPKHKFITNGLVLSIAVTAAGCSSVDSQSRSPDTDNTLTKGQVATFPISKGFKVFNGTRYKNTGYFDQIGLVPFTTVYDVWNLTCDANNCYNVPDKEAFKKVLTSYVSQFRSSEYIAFDFEKIVIDSATSEEQAKNEVTLIKQLIAWAREAYPNAKLGMYDYDFNDKFRDIKAQLYQQSGFDFFAPTLYQRWPNHASWRVNLQAVVNNDRAINASLPIYAYVSPYKAGRTASGLLTDAEWLGELSNAGQALSGIIIWTANTQTDTLNTTQSWIDNLRWMMSSH